MVAWLDNGQGYWTFEEVSQVPVIKKMISKFRVDQQEMVLRLFYSVHANHYAAWESSERKQQHSIFNISKITWNREKQCFQVYYKKTKWFDATWYHYTLDGKWY